MQIEPEGSDKIACQDYMHRFIVSHCLGFQGPVPKLNGAIRQSAVTFRLPYNILPHRPPHFTSRLHLRNEAKVAETAYRHPKSNFEGFSAVSKSSPEPGRYILKASSRVTWSGCAWTW
jgi:hypothetical protein